MNKRYLNEVKVFIIKDNKLIAKKLDDTEEVIITSNNSNELLNVFNELNSQLDEVKTTSSYGRIKL